VKEEIRGSEELAKKKEFRPRISIPRTRVGEVRVQRTIVGEEGTKER
jgi:hypothetical protein